MCNPVSDHILFSKMHVERYNTACDHILFLFIFFGGKTYPHQSGKSNLKLRVRYQEKHKDNQKTLSTMHNCNFAAIIDCQKAR